MFLKQQQFNLHSHETSIILINSLGCDIQSQKCHKQEAEPVQIDWTECFHRCNNADEQMILQTNRAHLIKSLQRELSHKSICFEAFRHSTKQELAEGSLIVQQKPLAAGDHKAK